MSELLPVSFGSLLRSLRMAAGMTQEELAEAARVSYRSISDLERGVSRSPRRDTARLLADALGLSGDDRARFEAAARGRPPAAGTMVPGPLPGGIAAATRTLPRDIASFTGREQEIESILGTITGAGGVVDICVIDGMAGIGKTALAVHAAHLLATDFPDGQLFVGLHAHTPGMPPADPADVLAGLLACTGLDPRQIPEGLEARAQRWRGRLADRKMLLVLDDAAGNAQVEPLLPGTPGCLVLVTSRRRLIALPGARPLALDTLPPAEAARLLARLSSRDPASPADVAAAADLAALCGHLPLAIALLAGRLAHRPGWTLPALATDLAAARGRLPSLAAGDRPGDPAVTAAFDMSYNGLPAGRQRLFRLLSLHPGTGIDAWAAAALADIPLAQAREGLDALYGDHLVDEPAPGRYRLHDLLREYAGALTARHDPAPGCDKALGRLLDYYQHVACTADRYLTHRAWWPAPPPPAVPPASAPDLSGPAAALAWMRAERASLLACIDSAAERGQPKRLIALTATMAGFLDQEGPWPQAAALHEAAAAAARRLGDRLGEANALSDLGRIRYLTGDYPAAARLYEQTLAICREIGHRPGEANTLWYLGHVRAVTADYPAAADLLEQALASCQGIGDRLGEANSLLELGRLRAVTGDYLAAARLHEQSMAIYQDIGHRLGEANASHNLGRVRAVTGDYPAAARLYEQALAVYQDVGYRLGVANALCGLGRLRAATGDYPAAARLLEQSLAICRDLGQRRGEANALCGLGRVRSLTGEWPAAAGLLERSVALFRDVGDQQGEAEALNATGMLLAASAGPREALAAYRQALHLARQIRSPLDEAQALEGAARCAARAGDQRIARADLREAVAIYQRIRADETGQTGECLASQETRPEAGDGR